MKRFLIALFLFSSSFFTLFSSGFIDSQDGFQYLAIARRMYYDHTFEMPPGTYPTHNIHLSKTILPDGAVYSPTGLGYSLALLPAVAFEDVLNRLASTEPTVYFPLENDWPVLLFASMVNAFFAGWLVVVFFLYLRAFDFSVKQAVLLAFAGIVATNLFPYSKHAFAHMMFVSFMVASFYFLKRFGQTQNRAKLVAAGSAFGVVMIAYNPTFVLLLPAFGVYYLYQRPFRLTSIRVTWASAKGFFLDVLATFLGLSPFAFLYGWFNWVRFGNILSTGYGGGHTGGSVLSFPPAYVFFEGFWGLLFSPGKSIFLFTPLLLLLCTHWFYLSKKFRAEIAAAGTMFLVFLYFVGTLLGDVDFLVWHGEASWGPRYLLPTLPLSFLLVAAIIHKMSKAQVRLIVIPLLIVGAAVNLTGMLLPYQLRFAGMKTDEVINGRNYTVFEYGNAIPRYSPVFNLAKMLVKRIIGYQETYDHGAYNLVLKDGFNRPFFVPGGYWREPFERATFEVTAHSPIHEVELRFRNHQIRPEGTASAQLTIQIDQEASPNATLTLEPEQEEVIKLNTGQFQDGKHQVVIHKNYLGVDDEVVKTFQVVFLQSIHINGVAQPIGTVDYPYVSPISKNLFGASYSFFGNRESRPWEIWHVHSGVYESGFDLWWLRPLLYWDFPRHFFWSLFALDLAVLFISGTVVVGYARRK